MIVNNLPSANQFIFSLLNKVNKQIMDWNLDPVTGNGLYNKHDSIAYLQIKMYATKPGEYTRSNVIWNVSETQVSIDYPVYKADIEKSLIFFLRYISALKGETVNLTFEINSAGFDRTATRFNPFEYAAIYSIIDCFDKDIFKFKEEYVTALKGRFR